MPPEWQSADSSNIKAFAYDAERQELYVTFHHKDRKYTYFNVSQDQASRFMQSPSIKDHLGLHVFQSGAPI